MCKSRPVPINPEKMGDNIYGISSHVSFIDHLDIGLSSVTGGRWPAPPDPRRPVCLSQGHLLEDNPRQALHPPPEPPDLSQHDLPAAPVNVDSDQHDGNCPGSQPRARLHEEIATLQKRNQLIELQNRRSQLMEQAPMTFSPGNKYPVM